MVNRRQEDINAILQCIDNQHSHQPAHALQENDGNSREHENEQESIETIHVYFVRESESADYVDEQVVESTLAASADNPLHLAASEAGPAGPISNAADRKGID